MKKLSLFLVLLLSLAQLTMAQSRRSTIQIRLRNDKLLTVVFDGRHYMRFGRTITFGDVPAGSHDIKVYRYFPNDDPRYSDSRPRAVLIYKGRMRVDPATTYFCIVDPQYKTMSIRESREEFYDDERTYKIEERPEFDEDREDKSYDRDKDRDWDRDKQTNSRRDQNILNDDDLYTLKSAVDERYGSDDKVRLIKNYLQDKKMSTEQVKTIVAWLSFESSKLEVAKYCYPRTTDQDKYLQVSSLLNFQNSKNDLEEEIFKNKKPGTPSQTKPQIQVLNTARLNQLSVAVKEKITDTDKQNLMQQELGELRLTTAQVSTMLDWLTFEGSKLEFAKWAYPKVNDRLNYGQLRNKFSFLSSKKAIDNLMLKK